MNTYRNFAAEEREDNIREAKAKAIRAEVRFAVRSMLDDSDALEQLLIEILYEKRGAWSHLND